MTGESTHPSRGVRGRLRRIVQGRRRNHDQSDDQHGRGGSSAGATDLLPRHPADRRRSPAAGRHPGRWVRRGAIEGWMPFGRVFETLAWGRRHVVMGANQVDRYGNQNISAFGPLQQPTRQMFGCPRRARQHDQPRDQLLGGQPLQAGVRRRGRRRLRNRLRQGRRRQSGVPVRQRLPGGVQPRRVRLRRPGRARCGRCPCTPACRPTRSARHRRSRCTVWTRPTETRLPTDDELRLIREVIDPKALRDREIRS